MLEVKGSQPKKTAMGEGSGNGEGHGGSRPERSESPPQVTLNPTRGNVDWLAGRSLMPLSARGFGEQCGYLHPDPEAWVGSGPGDGGAGRIGS